MVAILGPTASGKSAIAEAVALRYGAAIVSVDSMQVYRGMDIGTAKPSLATRQRIEHHLIDIVDPSEEFSVTEFQRRGRAVLHTALRDDERIVVVGGSGLHFRALVDPMTFPPTDAEIRRELEAMPHEELQRTLLSIDAEAAGVVDMLNSRRVVRAIEVWRITSRTPSERARSEESAAVRSYQPVVEHRSFGFDSGKLSAARVEARFRAMMESGLLDEVASLAPRLSRTAAQGLGYKELLGVVTGTVSVEEASREVIRATNALAKRQRTFFGRDPRIEAVAWQDDEGERVQFAVDHMGEVAGWSS